MKRRIISMILALVLLTLPLMNVSAYTKPGPTEWDMEPKYLSEIVNAQADGSQIKATDGGYVTYEYYIEMEAEKVEIHYTNAVDAQITVESDDSSPESYKAEGASGSVMHTFTNVLRNGDHKLILRFKGEVTVTSIRFFAKHQATYNKKKYLTLDLSQEEFDIQTAVILKTDSSVILVNGSRRYIDEEDVTVKPRVFDGSIYLPIKTLSRALGYYYEEFPDKDYCMLRLEQKSFVYRGGSMVYQDGHKEPETIGVVPRLAGGTYWLPVRYFAEALGETVIWKDGLVIIDGRTYANKIANDSELYSYTLNRFNSFVGTPAGGNTYYVAQTFNADDNNAGTIDAPFRTLAKAGQIAKAGDTVIIREGTYREILRPQNDGTGLNPITFRAAEGEKVTISAAEVVDNFVDRGDGIAAAKMTWDLGLGRNQIFYNGECIVEARYPNDPAIPMAETREPLSSLFPVRGDFMVTDDNADLVVSDTLLNQTEKDYWKGAIYVSMHGYAWTLASAQVGSSEQGKLHLTNKSDRWWYAPETQNKADWGYLAGHINCMDLPGEWVVQNGVLLMLPPEGETPESLSVEVKKRDLVIDLSDRKYIRVEGINTIGGSAIMNESEMCTLNNMDMRYISHFIWADNWRDGYINPGWSREAEAAGLSDLKDGVAGIHLSGRDNRIINSRLDHSASAGIVLTGLYAYIENNLLSNCGYGGTYISGISAPTDGSKGPTNPTGGFALYNNTVYNCGRSCLNIHSAECGWNTGGAEKSIVPYEVAYNDFHDGVLFSLDGGITYDHGVTAINERLESRMHNNYVYYTLPETNPYSFGLYHDGNAHGIDTWENVIFTTEPDVTLTSEHIFSNVPLSPNIMWNNASLRHTYVPVGPENIQTEQFPYAQPFYAGTYIDAEPFMRNYNDEAGSAEVYRAEDADYSESCELDSRGSVVLDNTEDLIVFRDVDLGEDGKNFVDIYFRGERFRGKINAQIGFGDSPETADMYGVQLDPGGDTLEQIDRYTMNFNKHTGKTNVYIRVTNNMSVAIEGLIFTRDDNYKEAAHDGSRVNAAEFNRVDAMGSTAPAIVENADASLNYVKDTWGGTILRYQNVTIPEGSKVFYINTGVSGGYEGQEIIVSYSVVGDASNTHIATVVTPANGWSNRNAPQYIELDKVIPVDVADVYVEFKGAAKTCNFFEFGFLSEMPE